jgi:cytochrome c peroxidase
MWDGGVNNLEVQPINPITNPLEMDNSLAEVVEKLNKSPKYRKLFYKVFEDSVITSQKMLKALAQYTSQLVSYNSKYDSVMRKEKGVHFTQNEQNGYLLFKQHCASCHTEPLFTNHGFENNGLAIDDELKDWGRMKITQNSSDSLKFKVPTLRNIEFSAPYFHDGRVNKLKEAVNHYSSGIVPSKTLATALKTPIVLSEQGKKDLVSFLKTLTDKSALYSERYRYNYSESLK